MTDSQTLKRDILDITNNKKLFNNLANKTVLVTGATGLIGSMIVRSLCTVNDLYQLNIKVIANVRNKEKALDVLKEMIDRSDVILFDKEISDSNIKCNYIIHAASPTRSDYFSKNPVETIDFMVSSTAKILDFAYKNKVDKVVYLSSMEQYGIPYKSGETMTEDKYGIIDHLTVRSCYPESKRLCECYCKAYSSEYGLNVSIIRLAQTFGAGVPISDNRVFMQFAKSVINNNDIILHTTGESMSNFCYLTDAIRGIFVVLDKGKSGEAYNACNDSETRTVAQIANLIINKIALNKIKLVFDIPKDSDSLGYAPCTKMYLCSNKLMKLGWKPKISMEEAYRRLIKYLIEVDTNE